MAATGFYRPLNSKLYIYEIVHILGLRMPPETRP